MKKINFLSIAIICVALFVTSIGCNDPVKEDAAQNTDSTSQDATTDMTKVQANIQSLENDWAKADNARDTDAVAAFYSDDAMSLANNKPILEGKAAIRQDIATSFTKRKKGNTVSYDIMKVYGNENTVTEIGKVTTKDSTGKVTYTGKYMAVWEKRDGKYICVSDISNDDEKSK